MPKVRQPDALARLGQRLRARRMFLQLPLNYTASEMQLTAGMLRDYEQGKCHPPALTLARMAKVLGTTTASLLAERRPGNEEDVARALQLMGEPAIHEVANTMWRLDGAARQQIVEAIRTW